MEASPGNVAPRILARAEHVVSRKNIDPDALKVLYRLKDAGYPAKAKPIPFMGSAGWTIVAILTLMVIYVTMVYGPIAAMLVEMFPTRIRYTSMSLPYHIGNGWFGGLLPTTAFAIVAQTGNMYNGLWYPIIIALGTFVIGMLFVKETKDVDIYAGDSDPVPHGGGLVRARVPAYKAD